MDAAKLHLLPCYEGQPHQGEHSPFYRFHGGMTGDEHWAHLLELCAYAHQRENPPDTPSEATDLLLKRNVLVIGGGLIAAKSDFRLYPSCCCGIDDWRGWLEVKRDGPSPWMGHDPGPWIDTSGAKAILHNDVEREPKTIEADYEEIKTALRQAEKDLRDFLRSLEDWLASEGIEQASALGAKIDQQYGITQEPVIDPNTTSWLAFGVTPD